MMSEKDVIPPWELLPRELREELEPRDTEWLDDQLALTQVDLELVKQLSGHRSQLSAAQRDDLNRRYKRLREFESIIKIELSIRSFLN